ncbi:MAG: RNA polymerase sigma factor [Defluviitaleaceae bacterium]|nr:RNA polymerase sigma factor [Defluviitaleaceae bacterium]
MRFDEIYDATKKTVLAYITAKCARTADIKDIFQETYTALYKVLEKRGADYVKHDKAFVMKIAKRKVAGYYSFMQRMRNIISLTAVNDGEEADLSGFDAERFMTEDFTVNYVLLESLRKYLSEKPEVTQKVFHLVYGVGLTIPETAEMLGIGESNVKNRLYRTLKELRVKLTQG